MASDVLAVDFGTSNTAAAVVEDGAVRPVALEDGGPTLPTAVFFPEDRGPMRIGQAAVDALIAGEEGRFMRALKSILGTPLLHESRPIGGRRRTLAEIVTAFLAELRRRAEAQTGRRLVRVLSGRPVRFHSADPEADGRAEADLRACYLAAGFEAVAFLPEPEAAALACAGLGRAAGIGLVVDVGGGTSDFSVFRGGDARAVEILASRGLRLGGTDFDQAISMATAMPELGLGGALRREMGPGRLPVPRRPFVDLSSWAKIPFLYTPETRRMVDGMVRLAVDPERLGRLATVLETELGHDLAFAVEAGKIAANGGADGAAIDMGAIAPGLSVPLTACALDAELGAARDRLHAVAAGTVAAASLDPDAVERIVLVGGSSLMGFVREAASRLCPRAELVQARAFTAVVDGLAMAARDGAGPTG